MNDEIINKQYISLIHKVIVTAINNYSYDEVLNNTKQIYFDDEADVKLKDSFTSAFMFYDDLKEMFEDEKLYKIISNLDDESKNLIIDIFVEEYSLKELTVKYNCSSKTLSARKNRLLKKIKNTYLKKE